MEKQQLRALKKVSRQLRAAARFKGARVLDNVSIHGDKVNLEADHIFVGYFGILVVHTISGDGELYGEARDQNWVLVKKDRRTLIPNPHLANQTAMEQLRRLLSQNGIYRVNVESLVVFCGKKSACFVSKTFSLLTLDELKKYFSNPKFREDHGVDTDKIFPLLRQTSGSASSD